MRMLSLGLMLKKSWLKKNEIYFLQNEKYHVSDFMVALLSVKGTWLVHAFQTFSYRFKIIHSIHIYQFTSFGHKFFEKIPLYFVQIKPMHASPFSPVKEMGISDTTLYYIQYSKSKNIVGK